MAGYPFFGTVKCVLDKSKDNEQENEYPLKTPVVFLRGEGEETSPNTMFSWLNDQVILRREGKIYKYNRREYTQFLMKDERGKSVWVDPHDLRGDAEDWRDAEKFDVTVYDLETMTKQTFECVLKDEKPFELSEVEEYLSVPLEDDEYDYTYEDIYGSDDDTAV